jgi:hypothetical protein
MFGLLRMISMEPITLSMPTLALIQELATRVHTTPRDAVHRAALLMRYLLDAQEQGQKLTLEDTNGQLRKVVITHYSDGTISTHADRIVL